MPDVSVSVETGTTGPTGSSRRATPWYTNRAEWRLSASYRVRLRRPRARLRWCLWRPRKRVGWSRIRSDASGRRCDGMKGQSGRWRFHPVPPDVVVRRWPSLSDAASATALAAPLAPTPAANVLDQCPERP